jgi:hypothetical protein
MVIVAPPALPVAVAGGLGRLALLSWAQIAEDTNNAAIDKARHRLIAFFMVIIVSFIINFSRTIKINDLRKWETNEKG